MKYLCLGRIKALISLAFFLILVACGGGGGNSTPTPTSSPSPSPSITPSPSPTITITPTPTPTAPIPGSVSLDTNAGSVANGAINVSTSPIIVLKFSLPMQVNSINNSNIILSAVPNGTIQIPLTAFTANTDNTEFHFSSISALRMYTHYYIIVKNTEALDGSIISNSFSFTTGGTQAPSVSMVTPNNGASSVPNTTTMQISFSQAVNNVNSTNVVLHANSANGTLIPIATITPATNGTYVYNITPAAPLEYSTAYYLTLSSGITNSLLVPLTPTTFSFTTARAPILYFANFVNQNVTKCNIDQFGVLINCSDSGVASNPFDQPFAIAINHAGTYAYVTNVSEANGGGGTVSLCTIASESGGFTNCINSGATNISAPYGIMLNEALNLAYIMDFNINSVTMCNIDPTSFMLSSCSEHALNNVNFPKALTFDSTNTHAYITNHAVGVNQITLCDIESGSGNLVNCNYATTNPINLTYPFSILIANNVASIVNYNGYNTNNGTSSVINCTVNNDGTLTNCADQTSTYQNWSFGAAVYDNYNAMIYFLGTDVGSNATQLFACMNNNGYLSDFFCSINNSFNSGVNGGNNGFNSGAIRY